MEILLVGLFMIVAFSGLLLFACRCKKGGLCDYEETSSRFVKGHDIGFGVTNSFTSYTARCKKCGKEYDSYH